MSQLNVFKLARENLNQTFCHQYHDKEVRKFYIKALNELEIKINLLEVV